MVNEGRATEIKKNSFIPRILISLIDPQKAVQLMESINGIKIPSNPPPKEDGDVQTSKPGLSM